MALKMKSGVVNYKDGNSYEAVPGFYNDGESVIQQLNEIETQANNTVAAAEGAVARANSMRDELEAGLNDALGYTQYKQYLLASNKGTSNNYWNKTIIQSTGSPQSRSATPEYRTYAKIEGMRAGTYTFYNLLHTYTIIYGNNTYKNMKELGAPESSGGLVTVTIDYDFDLYVTTIESWTDCYWINGSKAMPSGEDTIWAESTRADSIERDIQDIKLGLTDSLGYTEKIQYLYAKNKTAGKQWTISSDELVMDTSSARSAFASVTGLSAGTYYYKSLYETNSFLVHTVDDNPVIVCLDDIKSQVRSYEGTFTVDYDFDFYGSTATSSTAPSLTKGSVIASPSGVEGVWGATSSRLDTIESTQSTMGNDITTLSTSITNLETNFTNVNNKIHKYLVLEDADLCLRKYHSNSDSEEDDATTGDRIRILYNLVPPYTFSASCSLGAGVAVSLYETQTQALKSGSTGVLQYYTNNNYNAGVVHGTVTQDGWLTISLKKSDNSAITDVEKAALLAATNIRIYTTSIFDPYTVADRSKILALSRAYTPTHDITIDSETITKQNLSFAVITDLHGDQEALKRFKDVCNANYDLIDFAICLGDTVSISPSEEINWLSTISAQFKKPFYYIAGNHDVANSRTDGITEATIREKYFGAIETKGWLSNATTNTDGFAGEGKCSWYKDFDDYHIRLIGLYEYNKSDTHNWDSTKVNIASRRWLTSASLQWFADTLYSTPSGYGVIVFLHQAPHKTMSLVEHDFCTSESLAYSPSNPGQILNIIDGNPIQDIVNAFIKKINLNGEVYASDSTTGFVENAAVIKDFSARAEYGKFIGYFVGHTHSSYILKNTSSGGTNNEGYPEQLCICVPSGCNNFYQRKYGDMPCDGITNSDNFYFVGITNSNIHLMQVGGHTTIDFRNRDIGTIACPTYTPPVIDNSELEQG